MSVDVITCDSRDLWLAERRKGIGGSDVAAIMGVSRWKSPLQLWAEKRGEWDPPEPGEAAEWGHRLEDVVARKWQEGHPGTVLEDLGDYAIVQDDAHPHRRCTPDRLVHDDAVLSLKTCGVQYGHEWEDSAPLAYRLQGQWEAGILQRSTIHYACLIGGQRYVEHTESFRPDLFSVLCRHVDNFWRGVIHGHPPDVSSPGDLEVVRRMPAGSPMDAVARLGWDEARSVTRRIRAQEAEKRLGDLKKTLEAQIRFDYLGYDTLVLPDGRAVGLGKRWSVRQAKESRS